MTLRYRQRARRAWHQLRASCLPRYELRRPDQPLDIDRLISPVRYDVLVRANDFRFFAERLDVFHDDFDAYTALAMGDPYYEWFRTIAHPRFVGGRDLHTAFRERLQKAAGLYLSFTEHGFDARFPIVVASSGPVATTATGKVMNGRQFPVDGCHRLALLHVAGYRQLPAEWCWLRVDRRWSPPDNTHSLIPALGIQPAEYYGFISRGYAGVTFEDEASLLAHLELADPGVLDEVRGVIAVDRPVLARAGERGYLATSGGTPDSGG